MKHVHGSHTNDEKNYCFLKQWSSSKRVKSTTNFLNCKIYCENKWFLWSKYCEYINWIKCFFRVTNS